MIDQINGAATAATSQTAAPKANPAPKAEAAKTASPSTDAAPISPRLRFDALSGVVVTEFLNGKNVQSQTPSAAALAYLRMGLSADGRPQTDAEQQA